MKKLLLILVSGAFSLSLAAQKPCICDTVHRYDIDSLKNIFGKHKQLLNEYEEASLIALSCYPELTNEFIRFRFSSINSTAKTTMTWYSVFKKINKYYIININDDVERTGLLLNQVPFDAQVALIGHELAHIVDFKKRSFLKMAWWGLNYLLVKQRAQIEKAADKATIRHGLGKPLYHWADFILYHSTATKEYLKMKESKYLSPAEILKYMKICGLPDCLR